MSKHYLRLSIVHLNVQSFKNYCDKCDSKQKQISLFLYSGQGGVGKSTSLKQLALLWANRESEELKQFDFVFHIALRFVKKNETLEEVILKQHKGLSRRNVSSAAIAKIINGEEHKRVLLMLDGYDEYTPGTNNDIDCAIVKGRLPDCCVFLTSRDTKELTQVKHYMDVEAEITGFDPKRIKEYITKYLESANEYKSFMQLATSSNLISYKGYGILQVPIMLHMICFLYQREESLPKTMTGVISAIVERCPDWEEIRRSGQKTVEEIKVLLESALVSLGKVCWERLQPGNKDLIFTQVRSSWAVCFWNAPLFGKNTESRGANKPKATLPTHLSTFTG